MTDIWELDKMPRDRLEKITVSQIEVDMLNFPLKAPKELGILGVFTNLKELSLEFKFHTFDNHHKEFVILNNALNSLENLQKLSLILINRYAECVNDTNFLYWFDIENKDLEIQELVNWKGLKDEALDIIFNKTFDKCKEIQSINLNFSYNGITAEGIEKIIDKMNKLKGLKDVFLDFGNQKELNVKKGEKLIKRKHLCKCFSKVNLEKNLGFFFFSKKTIREVSKTLLGEKLKNLLI